MSITELNFPRKDPDAKIPYSLDWSDWLDTNEIIDTAVITVTGASKLGENIGNSGKSTDVIIGGGVPGDIVQIHFHITTDTLVEDERTVNLEIVEM